MSRNLETRDQRAGQFPLCDHSLVILVITVPRPTSHPHRRVSACGRANSQSQSLPKRAHDTLARQRTSKENLLFKASLKEPSWLVGAHVSLSREKLPGLPAFNSDPPEACPLSRTHLQQPGLAEVITGTCQCSQHRIQKRLQDAPELIIKQQQKENMLHEGSFESMW